MTQDRKSFVAWLQAAPMMLIFALFFLLPLVFVTIVSTWDYNEYEMIPAFSLRGYSDTFEGCIAGLPDLCTILKTYLKTLKLCVLTWSLTLLIGFTVAYFLAFHVRSKTWQIVLTLLCTIPFWTSNVIRMIAWIPLLGRNGLVNRGLEGVGLINAPLEWLLFSEFSVVLGGQQIASAGKIIEARLNALQFPAAAANAVILLGITILIISSLTRIVDIRKEL